MEARLETERQAKLDDKRAKRAQLNPPPPPAPAPKSVEDDLIHDDERNGSDLYSDHSDTSDTFRHCKTAVSSFTRWILKSFQALHNLYQKSENQT